MAASSSTLSRFYTAVLVIPPVASLWLVAAALLPRMWLTPEAFAAEHSAPLHQVHLLGELTVALEPALAYTMGLFVVLIATVVALTNLRGTWRVSRVIRQLDVQAAEPPAEHVALVNDVARKAGLSVGLVMSDYPLAFIWGFRGSKLILSSGLLRTLTAAELRGVLEHEAAHHARRDNLVKLLLSVASYGSLAFPLSCLIIGWRGTEVEVLCGGWLLNTADNVYCGAGQFDGDPRKDMVIMSPWGLGIISMQSGSHVFLSPNGARLGGWLLDSTNNVVRLIADLDGDGKDEILISSPWGIGVLKMWGNTLTSIAIHANGENLGGYVVGNSHNFALADNLKGGVTKQIVVTNSTGIHVLRLAGNRLVRLAFAGNGARVDGWTIDSRNNRLQPAGDMNGDRNAEFVIGSPGGIGIMGLDSSNSLRCYTLHSSNSMLNDWFLQSGDVIIGAGNLSGSSDRKELLIVKP